MKAGHRSSGAKSRENEREKAKLNFAEEGFVRLCPTLPTQQVINPLGKYLVEFFQN